MHLIGKNFSKTGLYFCFILGGVFTSNGMAFEVKFVDPKTNKVLSSGVKKTQAKKAEPVYPLAAAGDVLCGKDHHMVRFRLNTNHAGMPFSITAKRMTRVKVRWDHPEKVMFPAPGKRKTIVFPHSGGLSNLYFRAHEPISGNVYIMNDNDVVIQTCPYSFLPAKRFRQSVSMNIGESENDSAIGTNSESRTVSLRYRISPKQTVPEGGKWSWSVGISQTENTNESRRLNSSFSYSW